MNQNRGKKVGMRELREDIVGISTRVPLLNGEERPYVFLDNAASTPTFRGVLKCIGDFLPWYSGVHRGTGFKSIVATQAFDQAHDVVARFLGADPAENIVVFTKNTTECINKLSNRFSFTRDDIVITTGTEHHSNDLPWRKNARVIHCGIDDRGELNLEELQGAIRKHKGRLRLIAISGASNITGVCPPIHEIAGWAHDAGASIFVDAAQLAPHRTIRMLPNDHREHIDFLALSAHKMYAPFGTGALVGPRTFFERGEPDVVGGGVVEVVTLDDVVWTGPPAKEEAGSPNVVGAVALAEAITILQSVGMDTIQSHEHSLTEYALRKLRKIRGLTLYGPTEDISSKVGVIPFNIDGLYHALVAAILGAEGGIGVRNGCFCAQPFVKRLLHVPPEEEREALKAGYVDKTRIPGLVRASFGCYNNEADVDALAEVLERIVRKEYRGKYRQNPDTGAFFAEGYDVNVGKYFSFFVPAPSGKEHTYSEAS